MISFIVIGKNEGSRLECSLQSVLDVVKADNITDWELIYVDSQSTDESLPIAKGKGARTFLITGECNAAIARNIGAKEARGDIFFFIDGDMEVQTGILPLMLQDGKLEYPFMSANFEDVIYDTEWNYLRSKNRHSFASNQEYAMQSTTGGLFLITREMWEKVGGMDNRLRYNEDYDLGLRVTQEGYPLKRLNKVLVKHHMRDYDMRDDYVKTAKYAALLFRNHLFNKNYWDTFVKSQYTTIILVCSLLLMFVCRYSILLYMPVLFYKWWKRSTHTMKSLIQIILRDMLLIVSTLLYHPIAFIEKYKEEV